MADPWTKAFGLYLRTLRERRGLSLADVASLSRPFADHINKGYLSRCENGIQRLAFSKVIPLSRIFEVPADVLLERMELDMELDRIGGPDTEGLSFEELFEAGKQAYRRGHRWFAYALLRDGVSRRDSEADTSAQAALFVSSAAKALGRYRFALHEMLFLKESATVSPDYYPILLDRIAVCLKSLGDSAKALHYVDEAIAFAQQNENLMALGCAYGDRAALVLGARDSRSAATLYRKAYEAFKASGQDGNCAIALNNLAQCYFELGRLGAARRCSKSAISYASKVGSKRTLALSHFLLGELDYRTGSTIKAVSRWRYTLQVAKEIVDHQLRFKAECALLGHAITTGEYASARAIHRRLYRLAFYVPKDLEDVSVYRTLVSEHPRLFSKEQRASNRLTN